MLPGIEQDGSEPHPSVLAALKWPANLITYLAVVNVIFAGVSLVVLDPATLVPLFQQLGTLSGSQFQGEEANVMASRLTNVTSTLLAMAMSAIMFIGGRKMGHAVDFSWAVAACVVAIIPCTWCYCLTIPIGIWGLVILFRPDVRAAFR